MSQWKVNLTPGMHQSKFNLNICNKRTLSTVSVRRLSLKVHEIKIHWKQLKTFEKVGSHMSTLQLKATKRRFYNCDDYICNFKRYFEGFYRDRVRIEDWQWGFHIRALVFPMFRKLCGTQFWKVFDSSKISHPYLGVVDNPESDVLC